MSFRAKRGIRFCPKATRPPCTRPHRPPSPVVEADALRLPFADQSFDLVTTAFGSPRDLANYDAGLLAKSTASSNPGGTIAILEFYRTPRQFPRQSSTAGTSAASSPASEPPSPAIPPPTPTSPNPSPASSAPRTSRRHVRRRPTPKSPTNPGPSPP